MKVEHLTEGSPDCPLIRLFNFTASEVQQLRKAFEALATGLLERVSLDGILCVENPDAILLEFVRSDRDTGIMKRDQRTFVLELSAEGWTTAAELAQPFCQSSSLGHQWLTNTGGIRLLLSPTGHW